MLNVNTLQDTISSQATVAANSQDFGLASRRRAGVSPSPALKRIKQQNDDMASADITAQLAAIAKQLDILPAIKQKHDDLERSIGNMINVQLDEKLTPFNQRLTDMEERLKTLSIAGSGGSGGSGGREGPGGTGRQQFRSNLTRAPFIPRYMEVKKYVIDYNTREGALEDYEVIKVLVTLYGWLPEEYKVHMDLESSKQFGGRVLFTKIVIRFKTDSDNVPTIKKNDMFRMRGVVSEFFDTAHNRINGRQCQVMLEPPADKRLAFMHGAKAMAFMENKGVLKAHLKPEWGPPVRIYYKTEGRKPLLLCSWDSSGWSIQDADFTKIVDGATAKEFMDKMR